MRKECYKITNIVVDLELAVNSDIYYPVQTWDDFGVSSIDLQFDATIHKGKYKETVNYSKVRSYCDNMNDIYIEKNLTKEKELDVITSALKENVRKFHLIPKPCEEGYLKQEITEFIKFDIKSYDKNLVYVTTDPSDLNCEFAHISK